MEELKRNSEQNQGNAFQSLSEMPSFAEHMRQMETFDEAKRNGTLPEGVRDEQDYREYSEQNEAKFNEARAFLYEHFAPNEQNDITPEALDRFLKSDKFEAFTRSGISLDTLLQQGIISDKLPNLPDSPYDYGKKEVFHDMTGIVSSIGHMQEGAEHGFDELTGLKPIIEQWGMRQSFNKIDTSQIVNAQTMGPLLQQRLLFGNPYMDIDDKTVSSLDHIRTTCDYLSADIEPGAAMDYEDFDVLELMYTLSECDLLSPHYLTGVARKTANYAIRERLGAICRKQTGAIAKLMTTDKDYYGKGYSHASKMILESANQNTVCEHYDLLREAGFTDEELLGSIYSLESGEGIKKIDGRKDPDYYLARHVEWYERAGFEQKSIIKILHDNEVYLSAEEIRDMRKDGVSNQDIAYAGRLYKSYWPERGMSSEKLEADGFSESDILMAALRVAREQG